MFIEVEKEGHKLGDKIDYFSGKAIEETSESKKQKPIRKSFVFNKKANSEEEKTTEQVSPIQDFLITDETQKIY
ncbi:MAG: hypothetical protein E7379_00960 [Clostridiales bacterium]|nr:hypothetical protein [Clostridiales bacterium]